ncbi:DUF2071 domain-containing protein [Natrinema salsiterrestre]|uniref:DUF2071 domain-containing protein n=1 Tax=Natrinema salsiterrestre TaxID=2950540 RepID=A0A9Q4Q0D8_9EURY|nr:DUF2071 domain-containing protein [Natrinema salsiterrestre]MDF9745799.1 DUF2071 domain-containing protein [Natrinema salsiterrestre]
MYWPPTLRGVIDRRVLVNFRIPPEALESVLPDRFRPRTVAGPDGPRAIGGICCIRLREMRLRGLPAAVGVTSENAAHRIGVEWDEDGATKTGVYVPRRDTSSRLNSLVGSRTFGRHFHADFTVTEGGGRYELRMEHETDGVSMSVSATETDRVPEDSIFPDVSAASAYHECGGIGYCPSPDGTQLNGIELATDEWHVTPLAVEDVHASFFETEIPADGVTFDTALLMRDIGHEWRARRSISTPETA